jgi:hypothetical protein
MRFLNHSVKSLPPLVILYGVEDTVQNETGARIYRPCFRENTPKTLVFND